MQKRTTIPITVEHIPCILDDNNNLSPYSQITHSPSDSPINNFHFHESLEIGYCYEGSGVFVVDGKISPFSKDDASIIFKNQIHIAQSEKGNLSKWRFIFIYPEQILSEFPMDATNFLLSNLLNMHNVPNIFTQSTQPKIINLIKSIISELDEEQPCYNAYVKILILQLLFELARLNNNSHIIDNLNRQTLLQITPALEYISCNYMYNIEVSKLADLCYTSERNLRRLFHKAFSLSPLEYIIKFRIKMSTVLLSNSNSCILDISNKVGFASVSSYNRHFKSLMGMSPTQWLQTTKDLIKH